ncbi:MAG: tetratricopeptide repeat protein [Nitrospirota bacterium]
MKIRNPFFNVRSRITGRVFALFVGLLLLVSPAAAAPSEDPLIRIESQLSLIKMDVLRLDQSGAIGSDLSSLPASGRASGSSEADLQEIAAWMKRPAPAVGPAADGEGTDRLPTDEMRLRLADYFLRENLVAQAEQTLRDIAIRTRREPIAAEAWFRLGKMYYRGRDYPQALEAFLKIPEKSEGPLRIEATYLAGNSYLYRKEYSKAIEWLTKVGKGNDFYPFSLYSSGLAHLGLGDARSSTPPPFQKLIALNPGADPVLQELINQTRVTLGFFWIDQRRYPEALDALRSVSAQSRYRPRARFGIGKAYVGMKDCVQAIAVLRDLADLFPVHPYALEARLLVGHCFSKLSAHRKAVESYQNAIRVYAERKEHLKKLIRRVQDANPEKGWPSVVSELNLENQPGLQELMEAYMDWSRLDDQIRRQDRQTQGRDGTAAGPGTEPDGEPMPVRMQKIKRELDALFQTAVTDQISSEMDTIDDRVARANTGIVKNTILMQDYYGTAP